jgi:hypothetical protein
MRQDIRSQLSEALHGQEIEYKEYSTNKMVISQVYGFSSIGNVIVENEKKVRISMPMTRCYLPEQMCIEINEF